MFLVLDCSGAPHEVEQARQKSDDDNDDDGKGSEVKGTCVDSETDDDSGLEFVRHTILGASSASASAKAAPTVSGPQQVQKKRSAVSLPSSSPGKPKAAGSKGSTTSPSIRKPDKAPASPPKRSKAATEHADTATKGRPSKANKEPRELLDELRFPAVVAEFDKTVAAFSERLADIGLATKEVASALTEFRKSVASTHRLVVGMEIKVKKWACIPEGVLEPITGVRRKTAAYQDACQMFGQDHEQPKTQGSIENLLGRLQTAECTIFPAVKVTMFKHLMKEYFRFRKVDDAVSACAGVLSELGTSGGSPDGSMETLLTDTIGANISGVITSMSKEGEERDLAIKFLCEFSHGVSSAMPWPDMKKDLGYLRAAFSDKDALQLESLRRLAELRQDVENYRGVLKIALASDEWDAVAASLSSIGKQDDVMNELSRWFEILSVGSATFTKEDQNRLSQAMLAAFQICADPSTKASNKNALGTILQGCSVTGLLPGLPAGVWVKWEEASASWPTGLASPLVKPPRKG